MSKRTGEDVKVDIGLLPTAADTNEVIGQYYPMKEYERVLFNCEIGNLAKDGTVVCKMKEADDGAGAGAADITNATCTITSLTQASEVRIQHDTVVADDEIKISQHFKGTVTTHTIVGKDTITPDRDAGEYNTAGNDEATATDMAITINHLFPHLRAEHQLDTDDFTRIRSREPGEATISTADDAGTLTPVTRNAIAQLEVHESQIGKAYVAVSMNPASATPVAASIVRSHGRYSPYQAVAAAKRDTSA